MSSVVSDYATARASLKLVAAGYPPHWISREPQAQAQEVLTIFATKKTSKKTCFENKEVENMPMRFLN